MSLNWLKNTTGSNPIRKHEPGVTSQALENHWKQAKDVILRSHVSFNFEFFEFSYQLASDW